MRGTSFFDTLREASFRGAPFEVEDADESGGRRLARHEYPLRICLAEDLGQGRGMAHPGFIVQGRKYDYAQARDDLRKALNAYGSGTLIHPWLGEMTVAVDRYPCAKPRARAAAASSTLTLWSPASGIIPAPQPIRRPLYRRGRLTGFAECELFFLICPCPKSWRNALRPQ